MSTPARSRAVPVLGQVGELDAIVGEHGVNVVGTAFVEESPGVSRGTESNGARTTVPIAGSSLATRRDSHPEAEGTIIASSSAVITVERTVFGPTGAS
jgi:hypothetical protein